MKPMRLVRMRLVWSSTALLAVLRRWAGFLIVAAGVLGIGYFVAAIGWPALPVLWASSLPLLAGLAVLTAHAGIATLLAWGLREALLPAHWLLAERALPLTTGQRARADLAVVALAQSPLFLLYLGSLLSWRHVDPVWLRGHWPRGLVFAAASVLLSLASATGLLALRRRQRRPALARWPAPSTSAARHLASPWTALLILPLWRGPARPVAGVLLWTLAGLLLLLAAVAAGAVELRWGLAGFAFVAMLGCTQAHARALRCYAPLIEASQRLPLAGNSWPLCLGGLALSPLVLAWPALALLLLTGPWALSPRIAPAYLVAAWLAPTVQMFAPSPQAEARAGRWMLALVLWVALATEMLR
jgi:hypothetical protein